MGAIRIFGLVVGVMAVLAFRPAQAATPEEKVKAREHYQRAITYYDLKEYADALTEFKNAYRLVQDAAFLFNIAQCHRKLGQNVEALDFYRNFLRRNPTAPNRVEVERRIDEIERELEANPPPHTAPAPPIAKEPPALAPSKPPPAKRKPRIHMEASEPRSSSPSLIATPRESERESKPVYKRWWFWTAVGAAVVGAAVVGIVIARRDEIGDCHGVSPCWTVGN